MILVLVTALSPMMVSISVFADHYCICKDTKGHAGAFYNTELYQTYALLFVQTDPQSGKLLRKKIWTICFAYFWNLRVPSKKGLRKIPKKH